MSQKWGKFQFWTSATKSLFWSIFTDSRSYIFATYLQGSNLCKSIFSSSVAILKGEQPLLHSIYSYFVITRTLEITNSKLEKEPKNTKIEVKRWKDNMECM